MTFNHIKNFSVTRLKGLTVAFRSPLFAIILDKQFKIEFKVGAGGSGE